MCFFCSINNLLYIITPNIRIMNTFELSLAFYLNEKLLLQYEIFIH